MKLVVLHQVFIAGAIGLCLLFAARGAWMFARADRGVDLALAIGALVVAALAGAYLRRFRRQVAQGSGGPDEENS